MNGADNICNVSDALKGAKQNTPPSRVCFLSSNCSRLSNETDACRAPLKVAETGEAEGIACDALLSSQSDDPKCPQTTKFDDIKTFTPTPGYENIPVLTNDELIECKKKLKVPSIIQCNRKFIDPVGRTDPLYALFSFIPHVNLKFQNFLETLKPTLTPNQQDELQTFLESERKAIHGVGKIRGAFYTLDEAQSHADKIIREIDSTNSVFTCKIGVPFPLVSQGFAEEVEQIDVKKIVETTIEENIRRKRIQDEQEIKQMKQRQDELKTPPDVNFVDEQEDLNYYITQRLKLAQLRYVIDKTQKQLPSYIDSENKTRQALLELDEKFPEFQQQYLEKYERDAKAVGLHKSENQEILDFMKKPIL
jgi:hypothetical protein